MFRYPTHPSTTQFAVAALAIPLALAVTTVTAQPRTYTIDPEHFSIGFMVEHVGYADTLGMFQEASGEFVYDEETRTLTSGRVEIAADSVFTNHDKRDEHLRGGDFLDAEDHPAIVFEATGFEPQGESGGQLTGKLTLLGETRPVTLDVTLNKAAEYPFGHGEHTLGLSARTTINRSEWGMTYAVDNGLVGDEVDLIFELEAIRQ